MLKAKERKKYKKVEHIVKDYKYEQKIKNWSVQEELNRENENDDK